MVFSFGGHEGSSPSPFDAVDRHRLAGPNGSHPLHSVRIDELVRTNGILLAGGISVSGPVLIGQGITGRVRIQAADDIHARGAMLRLVGLKLVEQRHSTSHHNSATNTTTTEEWVEANGELFVETPFTETPLPPTMAAGATFETTFTVPAPQLGPPTAHLGEAIVAWAIEARWDVSMHEDPFVACPVLVLQNPDLIRAGVGDQGGLAMLDTYAAQNGATVSITSRLPARPGTLLGVQAQWPSACGLSCTGGRTRPTASRGSSPRRALHPARCRAARRRSSRSRSTAPRRSTARASRSSTSCAFW